MRLAVGGTPRGRLLGEFERGRVDILVATPGRLIDMINSSASLSNAMATLKVLIFDEADQLLEMGFRKEMETVTRCANPERKTFMFSATLGTAIRSIAGNMLQKGYRDIDTVPANETDTHLKIAQSSLVVPFKEQIIILHQMLTADIAKNPESKVIVFFQTTKMVNFMVKIYQQLRLNVLEIHSKLDQNQRSRVSTQFRAARSAILFTTDVSAR